MTPAAAQSYVPVIFLDTNAVHFAKLALSFGAANAIDVLTTDWDKVRDQLSTKNVGTEAIKSYEKGYWILRYLHKRSGEPVTCFYSPITRLELLCGSLRGEAIKRAAQSGVPNRWYSRVEESEIRLQLESDGYTQVQADHVNIEQQFDAVGIVVNEQQLDEQVWQAARTLLESIFVDVQDCLVYASAFVQQANEVLTLDRYLSEICAWTHSPGLADPEHPEMVARFTKVNSAMVDWAIQTNGWDKSQVVFPVPRSIKQIKQYLAGGAS